MNYSDKDFMIISKSIFYQLFNRKLMFIVFTGLEGIRDTLMFSNVDPETMLIYDDSSKYAFSKVVIHDSKYLEDFYERFPLLKTKSWCIRIVDFLSTLAKNKEISEAKLSSDDATLYMSYKENNEEQIRQVGVPIQELEAMMYYDVWKSGVITSSDNYNYLIYENDYDKDNDKVIVMQDIANETESMKAQHALVILQPGLNIPTISAYRKDKLLQSEEKFVKLIGGYDVNSIIVNYEYKSLLLSAYGTHPAQRWFVKDKRSNG